MDDPTPRSFKAISNDDLGRLAVLALEDQERVYSKYPEWRGRFIAAALAQGAGSHFVTRTTGVKDFDVWSFFSHVPGVKFPFGGQRKLHRDFGTSQHGRQEYTAEERANPKLAAKIRRWEQFAGRRVDLMMRTLKCTVNADPQQALIDWLADGAQLRVRLDADGEPDMPSSCQRRSNVDPLATVEN